MTTQAEFLKRFNDAFAKADIDYITEHVTDDIAWEMVGDFHVSGKEAFKKSLKEMEGTETLDMQILDTIIQGDSASVNGTMKVKEASGKIISFGFCDIYELDNTKTPKVKKMISYVKPLISK